MTNSIEYLRSVPLWCKTTLVLTLGIALSVWFTVELTLRLDQKYLLENLHDDTQRSTDLLAGLLKDAILTRDTDKADSIIRLYASDWPSITFLHIDDEHSRFFTEWKKLPISFGEGILKYDSPVVVGGQNFGTLSLYVDQRDRIRDIQEHISSIERRVALTLLAMMLFISAVVSYAAMHPIKKISDDMYKLIQTAAKAEAQNMGADEISRLKSAVAFMQKMLDDARSGKAGPGGTGSDA